jgi:hypothetical protein
MAEASSLAGADALRLGASSTNRLSTVGCFETCVWIGRFTEVARVEPTLCYRKDIKLFLCGTMRAKDANIRQALLDLIGPQGTKAQPGPTYGIKSHSWAALAVAVYAAQNNKK